MFKRLFEPIQVGSMTLKNRFIMTAMHHLYTDNGFPTPRFNEYYWRRAEGGTALITVGACRFDDYGAKMNTMSLRSDDMIGPWREFTDGMRARGCKTAVQLYHAGRYMPKEDVPCGDEALAPSAVFTTYTGETAREMMIDEITRVIEQWAEAAVRAKKAGFDAVEISASAGYLICQFLSPVTNLRTDKYGGSWENRCRFPLEVINAVRSSVGKDYPIILRMAGNDLVPHSNRQEDWAKFAVLAEKAGVDMFSVTGGWHESSIPQLTNDLPRAGLAYFSQAIKNAVSVPVAMANRLGDPYTAEEVLALGKADLIAMGRPLLAEPDFPNKVQRGERIRPCAACNQGCLAQTFFDRPIRCLANGFAGREYLYPEKKAERVKNVLIVGGGIAGCRAVCTAIERGHKVTLWEKSERLGGQMRMIPKLPARQEFRTLLDYYIEKTMKSGADIVFGKEATAEEILKGNFDAVILAQGGTRKDTVLPMDMDAVPVYDGEQVINGDVVPGMNVVVVGGSFVGCETARLLARRGSVSAEQLFFLSVNKVEEQETIDQMLNSSERKVAIVDRIKVGTGYEPGVAWLVMQDLKRLGVERHSNTVVKRITKDAVIAEKTTKEGTEELVIPCDSVVFMPGLSEHNKSLEEELSGKVAYLKTVGNAKRRSRIVDIIEDAAAAAYEIE